MSNSEMLSRRTLLSVAVGAASALVVADTAMAAGTIPQKAVTYQETPKDGHACSGCKLFIPGEKADGPGTCKSVAGEINPNGWCKLWAAKA